MTVYTARLRRNVASRTHLDRTLFVCDTDISSPVIRDVDRIRDHPNVNKVNFANQDHKLAQTTRAKLYPVTFSLKRSTNTYLLIHRTCLFQERSHVKKNTQEQQKQQNNS